MRFPIHGLRQPVLFVSESRRPFGRADDGGVRPHQLQEIERLFLRQRLGLRVILRSIQLAAEIHGQTLHRIGVGNSLDAPRYVRAPPVEFALQLAD